MVTTPGGAGGLKGMAGPKEELSHNLAGERVLSLAAPDPEERQYSRSGSARVSLGRRRAANTRIRRVSRSQTSSGSM